MDLDKQKILVSALATNHDVYALCSGIIKPSYFDPTLRKTISFINEYFAKYKAIPKSHIIKVETGFSPDNLETTTRDERQFFSEEIEKFCRYRAAFEVLQSGPELLRNSEYDRILEIMKDAVAISLNRDLGTNYFDNIEQRIKTTLESAKKIPTGISALDKELIGISRQEVLLFAAPPNGGKSMSMLNLAKNLSAYKLDGVYISLEMSEAVVCKRLDMMLTSIPTNDLIKQVDKATQIISAQAPNHGKLFVKRMVEDVTTVSDIRSYLKQLEQAVGFIPDFIVLDYIDITAAPKGVNSENLFLRDKAVITQFRGLCHELDCIGISASQLGRGAETSESFNYSQIQGGMSKVNTADYMIGIKQTDLMKAAGEIEYQILKDRNGSSKGKKILLRWDPTNLSITSFSDEDAITRFRKAQTKEQPIERPAEAEIERPRRDLLSALKNKTDFLSK